MWSCPVTTHTSLSRYRCSANNNPPPPPSVCLISCPSLSVSQSRGGPLKFELSSWLQIEQAEPGDSGTYHCIARNHLGSVSASAVLGVLGTGERLHLTCS